MTAAMYKQCLLSYVDVKLVTFLPVEFSVVNKKVVLKKASTVWTVMEVYDPEITHIEMLNTQNVHNEFNEPRGEVCEMWDFYVEEK